MKTLKVSLYFCWLLFMVSGCAQTTEKVATSSPVVPVNNSSPTKTILPTLNPTATGTPTPTSMPTTVPTLTVDEARTKLLGLLANNSDCQLPCLWGITPGKSNYREARNILIPLSSLAETFHFDSSSPVDDISPLYVEGDLRLNTRVAYLYDNNDIVSRIGFRVVEEQVVTDSNGNWISKRPIFDSPTFIMRTAYYSLAHLLSEQGIPDSVMIVSSGPSKNRKGSIFTHIAVFYPDRGIWAQYTTLVNESEVGSSIISCPINTHIEMNLYPPGNPDSFYALLEQTNWGITKNSYRSLEEAVSMSVEEFYETFRQPTDKCLETPANLWPTPEP